MTTYALSNLLSAALKLKRCCIVVSNLSGSYEGASQQLRRAIHNFEREANRQARAVTPVDLASVEIYEILRKRMFKRLPGRAVVDSVAAAYSAALTEAVAANAIPRSAANTAAEIHGSYPSHPPVKHVVALFKENESFRQTRGLMQFVGRMLKSVWERKTNDVYLVGCQHLDLNLADVREEINQISNLQGAIAHDIAAAGTAVAELVDAAVGSDAGSQVAALLLTASLSESVDAVKGFTEAQFRECLIAPNRTVSEVNNAFERLRSDAWYLHHKESGAWYFSNIENLRKAIEFRSLNAPQPKIDAEMKRRLEEIFKPVARIAYQEVLALPQVDDIRLNGPRLCLVVSPDSKIPPEEVQRFWQSVIEKNNLCVVTGDGSDLASLEEKTRRIWAVARVAEETGGEASPHRSELEKETEQAAYDFNATVVGLFNRVFYPVRGKLAEAKLSMTFTANHFRGEEQIEKALAAATATSRRGRSPSRGQASASPSATTRRKPASPPSRSWRGTPARTDAFTTAGATASAPRAPSFPTGSGRPTPPACGSSPSTPTASTKPASRSPWTNTLTLTHQPRVLPNRHRQVELTVKPRGVIRWNTTGANPRDGEVYTGPIMLNGSGEEITVYAYAEDEGVSATRTFRIPAPDHNGPRTDETKPARLRKHIDFRGAAPSFEAINGAKAVDATLREGVSLTLGEGARTVTIRFGSETRVRPCDLEAFIALSRQVLGNEAADVVLNLKSLDFASGHDLEAFLTKVRVDAAAGEVEK